MSSISFMTKRTFFSYFKSMLFKTNAIQQAYLSRDLTKLKELLEKSNHWEFLSQRANSMSLVHDAVDK